MIDCVDVFCGLGGLTHGLSRGGIHVSAGIDLDPECRFPYESNNSARFVESDIREVSGAMLRKMWREGRKSLLAGCAPCQPFSTYGRHAGRRPKTKGRWDLVLDFGRLICESNPDLVTMENVPQVVDHPVFQELLSALKGYHVSWKIVDCVEYGVPQTRRRLVLLGSRLGPVQLNPAEEGKPRRKFTVRKAIAKLPRLNAGEADASDPLHAACRLSELNLRRIRASKPGGTWRDWDTDLLAECHKKFSGETYPSVYGRMEWDTPSPTITTQCFGYGNGRFGHPEQDRAITLREAALLQTFPRSYKFLRAGQSVRYSVLGRLIGNAVPVRIGETIARTLIDHVARFDSNTSRSPQLS